MTTPFRMLACSTLAIAALGCDEASVRVGPPRPERAPREAPISEPSPEEPAAPDEPECMLGAPEVWLEEVAPRGSVALAMGDERGLVISLAEGRMAARAISALGRASEPQRAVALAGASSVLALERRGARYLTIARGMCPESASCLLARALDAEGDALGSPVSAPLPDALRTSRRAGSTDADAPLFFAWSTSSGHRAIERYAIGAGGEVGRMRVPLGREPPSEEAPVEILGLAADGERWATLWRRGPTEDARSRVFLTSQDRHGAIEALHDALAVDAAELAGDTLSVVGTFEFSRPHHLRLRAGSAEPLHASELARGAPIPAPFGARQRAELDTDEEGVWLRRLDAAGDPVGSRVRVVDGVVESAAIARSGELLLVAWASSGTVRGRSVRCATSPTP